LKFEFSGYWLLLLCVLRVLCGEDFICIFPFPLKAILNSLRALFFNRRPECLRAKKYAAVSEEQTSNQVIKYLNTRLPIYSGASGALGLGNKNCICLFPFPPEERLNSLR